MATHPKKAVPKNALEAFAAAKPEEHIALLLWKNRHANPELTVSITEEDLKGYNDCMQYLKVRPSIAVTTRRNYVGIGIVEENTEIKDPTTGEITSPGNAIKPIENNEGDAVKAETAGRLRRLKETAPGLAVLIRNQAAAGEFSSDLILQAAEAIQVLCAT